MFQQIEQDKNGGVSAEAKAPFICTKCGSAFGKHFHLKQHTLVHKGVELFECNEPGCSSKFLAIEKLNNHKRLRHSANRPYMCEICGKRFATHSGLSQHRATHKPQKRFKCFYCTTEFHRRGDCKKHMNIRHSDLNGKECLSMIRQKSILEAEAELRSLQSPSL